MPYEESSLETASDFLNQADALEAEGNRPTANPFFEWMAKKALGKKSAQELRDEAKKIRRQLRLWMLMYLQSRAAQDLSSAPEIVAGLAAEKIHTGMKENVALISSAISDSKSSFSFSENAETFLYLNVMTGDPELARLSGFGFDNAIWKLRSFIDRLAKIEEKMPEFLSEETSSEVIRGFDDFKDRVLWAKTKMLRQNLSAVASQNIARALVSQLHEAAESAVKTAEYLKIVLAEYEKTVARYAEKTYLPAKSAHQRMIDERMEALFETLPEDLRVFTSNEYPYRFQRPKTDPATIQFG